MKSIEELTVTSGSIAALEPKIMTGVIEEAKKMAIGRQLLTINDQLMREGGRTLTFPYRTRGEGAGIVGEATEPPEVSAKYTTVTATVTKIGCFFKVTEESIETARIDVIQDQITEAGYALADFEDWMIMDELYGATPELTYASGDVTATNVFSLGTTEVLTVSYVTSNPVANIQYIDYKDGKVQMDADCTSVTLKFKRSTRSRVIDCSSIGTTGSVYIGLVNGRADLARVPRRPDTAVIHIKHWTNLVTDERFIDASKYGSREALLNGEVGKAAGMNIILADRAYPGAILVMQKGVNAYLVRRRELEMKRKELPENDAYAFYFYMEEIPLVTKDDAIVLVFNAAEGSKDIA